MRIKIDGEEYELVVAFDATYNGVNEPASISYISDEMKEVVNKCDHCGRFNLQHKVLHTVEELIENGWIKKVEGGS